MTKKGLVRQVSFKKSEAYVLDMLEERYKPFSFSNYVKQLIMKDIGIAAGNTCIEAQPVKKEAEAANKNDFKIDAEREELEL